MRATGPIVLLAFLATGCPAEEAALYVELRTDLVPGEEFVAIEVVLDEGAAREELPAVATDEFYEGRRIADLEGFDAGTHTLDVRLRDASGAEVASRRIRVRVDAQLALTVLITRGCAVTTCDEADRTCVRAACTPVECHEVQNPDACSSAECDVDADCPGVGVACATARCVLGACVAEAVPDACGAGEYCDVTTGCRPRSVGVDAGIDAGLDAGTDAGVDAGVDAGPCAQLPNPVGYWSMDAADVSGDTVVDRSGNGRDGMMMGTPRPVVGPGRVGEALDFSGTTTAWVDIGDLPLDGTPTGATTLSMWYRRDGPFVDEANAHFPNTPGAAPPRYGIWLNTDRIGMPTLCINTGSGECWGIADPNVIDRWVHMTAVVVNGDTTGGALYLDGAPVTMSCVFGSCTQSRTAMGPVSFGGEDATYAWHGLLDEVRVYDRALTGPEIGVLYACSQ